MGKWSSLKDTYPALPADPTHAEALAVATEQWASKPIGEIADAYNEARDLKDNLDDLLSQQTVTVEALKRVLVEAMERHGLTVVRTEGYHFGVAPEPYPAVKDKQALRLWAEEHMAESLALPWQTLKSVTKSALENGEAIPPGVDVFIASNLTRRKA